MPVQPVVRYMILCEDWDADPENPRRISILGLLTNIHSLEDPPYPLLYPELCVVLALTGGRGKGDAQIACVLEETGQAIFETPKRQVEFGPDPLEVLGFAFRIRDCRFTDPGMYSVQFWYNGRPLEERPLLLR